MLVGQLIKSLKKVLKKRFRFSLLKNWIWNYYIIKKNLNFIERNKTCYLHTLIYREFFESLNWNLFILNVKLLALKTLLA